MRTATSTAWTVVSGPTVKLIQFPYKERVVVGVPGVCAH